jgi:3-deoxy-D-manno-octulosonate 8-phosphate phosphatase (KDO 8-P phosphatase)
MPVAEFSRRTVPEGVVNASATIPRAVALRVRMVVFDVDGVLTDAGVYLGMQDDGTSIELKRFDIQDGLGLKFLAEAGLVVAMVSGRLSRATELRARELGIEECHQDAGADKLPVLERLLERHGLVWSQVAMLADDLPDLAVLTRVGLPAAVANAQPEIRERALWVSRRHGGHGAAREFSRALLEARGEWDERVASYVAQRGGEGAGAPGHTPPSPPTPPPATETAQ